MDFDQPIEDSGCPKGAVGWSPYCNVEDVRSLRVTNIVDDLRTRSKVRPQSTADERSDFNQESMKVESKTIVKSSFLNHQRDQGSYSST